MLQKENIKKYLYLGIMAYLAVVTVSQVYHLLAMIIAAIASRFYSFSAISAVNCIFSGLAYFALLAIVASVAVKQFASLKPVAEKYWFVPGALYAVVLLMVLISFFVSARYLRGFGVWLDAIISELFALASTALYLGVFMLLFPKALFLLGEEPVIDSIFTKKAGSAAPAGAPQEKPRNPYAQQPPANPYAAPQPAAPAPDAQPAEEPPAFPMPQSDYGWPPADPPAPAAPAAEPFTSPFAGNTFSADEKPAPAEPQTPPQTPPPADAGDNNVN